MLMMMIQHEGIKSGRQGLPRPAKPSRGVSKPNSGSGNPNSASGKYQIWPEQGRHASPQAHINSPGSWDHGGIPGQVPRAQNSQQ